MKVTDLLYHYTSADGLIGLLGNPKKNPSMWLTQIQYMNDNIEFYHAYELARNEILKLKKTCPNVRKIMSGLWGIPYDDKYFPMPPIKEAGMVTRYFCFSLTEEPDLLSQWRGYVPNGGYCLGFNFGELNRLAIKNGFEITRCIYEDNEKSDLLSKLINETEDQIRNGYADKSIQNNPSIPEEEYSNATGRSRIQQAVGNMSMYFKHSSFREEKEWRIVGIVGATDARARWRSRHNAIIPYAEIDISSESKTPLSTYEIIIGPNVDYSNASHAIQYMNYNQLPKPKIIASKSTLRF